jgi:hypothetical protein
MTECQTVWHSVRCYWNEQKWRYRTKSGIVWECSVSELRCQNAVVVVIGIDADAQLR